jgi:MFS family permease
MPERTEQGVYSRQSFLSIYLPAITLAIGSGIIIPVIPVYARSFDVSFGVASLVLVVQQIGRSLSAYPTGLLIDRVGRRRVVLAGPIMLAIASVLMANAHSFPELLVYRFIGGIGEQMWLLGRITMIADTGADRERGRQITTMHAMESAGRLLSPAIGGFLAVFWDIRAPFLAHALLCLIAIIPSFKLVQETAGQAMRRGRRGEGTSDAGWRALLTLPIIMFFVAQFFASLTRGPIFSGQLNLYAAYVYDLGPQAIGILATVVSAVGIPIGLASGYIMDRYGRKATLVPGFSLLAVALVLISFSAYIQVPFHAFVAFYLAVYASNGITGGNMQTLGSDIAPANARGQFYGVTQTMSNAGSPISTSLFAILSSVGGYWAAFAFLGLAAAGAAAIVGTQVQDRIRDEKLELARTAAASAPQAGS